MSDIIDKIDNDKIDIEDIKLLIEQLKGLELDDNKSKESFVSKENDESKYHDESKEDEESNDHDESKEDEKEKHKPKNVGQKSKK